MKAAQRGRGAAGGEAAGRRAATRAAAAAGLKNVANMFSEDGRTGGTQGTATGAEAGQAQEVGGARARSRTGKIVNMAKKAKRLLFKNWPEQGGAGQGVRLEFHSEQESLENC